MIDVAPAVAALSDATDVTILCHVSPDADTMGSGLALAQALAARSVPVRVAFAAPADLPRGLATLPGQEFLVPAAKVPEFTDLLIAVDAGSLQRLGALGSRLAGARRSLVLDHHRSNTAFGTINVVDEAAESTTVVVAAVLEAWGTAFTPGIAHCLYAGLVTDTSSFRWVRPGTHLLADRLLRTGIDGAEIAKALLDTHPFGWLPMLSRVLATATLVPDALGGAGLVHATVRRAGLEGLSIEEVESVIDIVRTTTEASVAAVFKEVRAGAPEHWTVSLRSRTRAIDVAGYAVRLGGGGHRFAAGYPARGPINSVVAELRAVLG